MNKLIISAVLLLLLTNIVVLSGVGYNRSGEPLKNIVLTERELKVVNNYSSSDENSGMALSFNWETPSTYIKGKNSSYNRWQIPWLTEDKLKSLGLDVDSLKAMKQEDKNSGYYMSNYMLSIEAILVLEYNGEAYKKELSSAEKIFITAKNNNDSDVEIKTKNRKFKNIKASGTRLYVIDAGLDPDELLRKYNDSSRYILMRGEIKPDYDKDNDLITGSIRSLFISNLHVPLPYAETISKLSEGKYYNSCSDEPYPPRYQIHLNLGNRLEPWITDVQAIQQ